jgi:hypothetical protein
MGSIDIEKGRDGLEEPAMEMYGPNDADGSFGPIVSFLLFSFVFSANYCLPIGSIDVEKGPSGLGKPAIRTYGPNDVSASFGPIVSFFLFPFVFFLTTAYL